VRRIPSFDSPAGDATKPARNQTGRPARGELQSTQAIFRGTLQSSAAQEKTAKAVIATSGCRTIERNLGSRIAGRPAFISRFDAHQTQKR